MFGKNKRSTDLAANDRLADFGYLDRDTIYMDSACQSMRPKPVLSALSDYYTTFNACGGRVKYAWGQQVDKTIELTRKAVLQLLKLSPKEYVTSFTLNTTYGLNLVLQQLPSGKFERVITSEIEHNSVFLPTITLAKRLGIERVVLKRNESGELDYTPSQLTRAIVVVNAVSNIDGRTLGNLKELVQDTQARGGIVIIDAAQTVAHNHELLTACGADTICFSAHKMYAPSLGVIVIKKSLLASLSTYIIGGGMVSAVSEKTYQLTPDDLPSRLEPGLQAYGEIIAFRATLQWLAEIKPFGLSRGDYMKQLSQELFQGLSNIPGLTVINGYATPVVSVYSDRLDAHRLAVFLSEANIMVRSGYFCCHYYLIDQKTLPPLLRFSIGLHSTSSDIQTTLATMKKLTGKT